MSDLIKRGRAWHMLVLGEQRKQTKPLIKALTDEVERLTIDNKKMAHMNRQQVALLTGGNERIAKLKARVDELEAALTLVEKEASHWLPNADSIYIYASQALKGDR